MVLLSTGSISFIQLIYVFHTFWLILPAQSHHNRLCHTYVYTMAFWSFSRTFSRIFLVLSSPKKFWLFWQCLFWLLLKCFNWSRYIFKYEPVVVSNIEAVGSSITGQFGLPRTHTTGFPTQCESISGSHLTSGFMLRHSI